MKRVFTLIAMLVIAVSASAQIRILKPKTLTWDHPHPELVEEYRMYCSQTPGVTNDPLFLVATIPPPTLPAGQVTEVAEWVFNLTTEGDWYCAVSAARPSESFESPVSNELWFEVIDFTPTNFREERPPEEAALLSPLSKFKPSWKK